MRPWSDLPVPSVAIRKKSALAVLTPKERARGNTKLQVAVSRAHCLRVRPKTSGVERVNLPNCAITKVSAASHLSPSLRKGSRECSPDGRLGEAIQCEGEGGLLRLASSLRSSH